MAAAIAAATALVEGLPTTTRFAVVGFGSRPEVLARMGATATEATAAIASIEASGETALYDGVVEASGLFDPEGDSRRVLVVLSDGADTVSVSTLDEATAALGGIESRVVALQTSESDPAALMLLGGGSVLTVDDASGLVAVYRSLALELTGRYRLVFQSTTQGQAEVSVFVDTPSGVVTARRTVELGEPVAAPGTTRPAGQAPSPPSVPNPEVTVAVPGALEAGWALPAGAVLVLLGLVGLLWLAGRGRPGGESSEAWRELEGGGSASRRLLTGLGEGARRIGDRVARRRGDAGGSLDSALDAAGVALRPGEWVVISATAIVVGVTAGLVMGGAPGAVALGGLAVVGPRLVLRLLTARRRTAFADQLEGTLQIVAGSLRAGYGLTQAISTVAGESPRPTSDEFERVVAENRLGRSIEDSMGALAHRMQSEDLGWVVEAIEIQHEVGGNLAEVLDTVTTTIRDRNLIRRQVHALSAEGRLSAIVLLALPFTIAGLIGMISPDYLAELTSSTMGLVMLAGGVVMMALGAAWIRRIVRVEY